MKDEWGEFSPEMQRYFRLQRRRETFVYLCMHIIGFALFTLFLIYDVRHSGGWLDYVIDVAFIAFFAYMILRHRRKLNSLAD